MTAESAAPSSGAAGIAARTLWAYSTTLVTTVTSLFLVGYVLRTLGTGSYGVYAVVSSTVALILILDSGISLAVARTVAAHAHPMPGDDAGEQRREVESAHGLYGVVALVGLAATGVLVALLPTVLSPPSGQVTDTRALTALSGISVALALGTSAYVGASTGLNDFRVAAVAQLSGSVAQVVVVVTLTPSLHLTGVGLGQLAAVVVNRAVYVRWLRRSLPWLPLVPRVLTARHGRGVIRFALPLVVLSIGGQAVTAANLYLVTGVSGVAAAGLFRLGSALPSQLLALLYRGYDVVYPVLCRTQDDKVRTERITAQLTRVTSYVAGLGFGAMAGLAGPLVEAFSGHRSSVAVDITRISCLALALNVPVHGVGLLLISRSRQQRFLPVAAGEYLASLGFAAALALPFGPRGVAWGGVIAAVLLGLAVLPLRVRDELDISVVRLLLVDGVAAVASGTVLAVGLTALLPDLGSAVVQLLAGLVLVGAVGSAAGWGCAGPDIRRLLRVAVGKGVGDTRLSAPPS